MIVESHGALCNKAEEESSVVQGYPILEVACTICIQDGQYKATLVIRDIACLKSIAFGELNALYNLVLADESERNFCSG